MKKWIMSHENMFDIVSWIALGIQFTTIFLRIWAFEKGTDGYTAMIIIWEIAVLVWFIAILLSLLSAIFKVNKPKSKYNRERIESFDWCEHDHCHFCIAVQLLNDKDFEAVCPHKGNVEFIGVDNACDFCKYNATVDFNTDSKGNKYIDLYIDDKILPRNNEVV